jgi:hypothetical protein
MLKWFCRTLVGVANRFVVAVVGHFHCSRTIGLIPSELKPVGRLSVGFVAVKTSELNLSFVHWKRIQFRCFFADNA